MIYTTLNRIRACHPCGHDRRELPHTGLWKLLDHLGKTDTDDEPLAFLTVLDSNGLDDALWCLRAEPQLSSIWRMYAVRRARSVLYPDAHKSLALVLLNVAENRARGLASDSDLAAARDAAWTVGRSAAWEAAGEAAWVAARYAAWEAARVAAWEAAWEADEVAARPAAWEAARDVAWNQFAEDFRAMLVAHDAQPEQECSLADW